MISRPYFCLTPTSVTMHPLATFSCHSRLIEHLYTVCSVKFVRRCRFRESLTAHFSSLLFRVNPFWVQLCYFLSLSLLGFFLLKYLDPKNASNKPKDLDLFFMSVSSVTLATMSTVEMEAFSNAQLVVITVLMLVGGEVFTSLLGLQLTKAKLSRTREIKGTTQFINSITTQIRVDIREIEELGSKVESHDDHSDESYREGTAIMYNSIKYLSHVVMVYLLVLHVSGCLLILLYAHLFPRTKHVLLNKRISLQTFSVFTTVSSFANAGFVPTNENMIVFRRDCGLLLLIIPQILLGNTLYPTCLRLILWVLWKVTRRPELKHMVRNPGEVDFDLLQPLHCWLLLPTVIGLILVQFVIFCWMEWHSGALAGMSSYEKIIGALFMSTNSRHGGQSIVDMSTIAPAVLVLYVIMMYLPPYTSFLPVCDDSDRPQRITLMQSVILSQLSYLSICIILICIIENKRILEDPMNFSVLNIVFEVISAYGGVGYTTGYSCQRRLKHEGYCKDAWYGFVGRWSNQGKVVMIYIMVLGRLKKFNLSGGSAWKLC